MIDLYDRSVDKRLLVRRITICANHVISENTASIEKDFEQLDLFTDYTAAEEKQKQEQAALEKERKLQQTALRIKKKCGKNAILKGINLQEGATTKDRNFQVGGHRTGEDDMLDLPHHQSFTRPYMSVPNHAAQFSPFAALTGYDDEIRETARLTDEKKNLQTIKKSAELM